MWNEAYNHIKVHQRMGDVFFRVDSNSHPLFINANMLSGTTANHWVDSLAAAFPAVQILAGDAPDAICLHNFYVNVWALFGALPERFNWHAEQAVISLYPLRPELAESTYFLYRATRNPFYLHVGKMMVESLNEMARTKCGFATVHSVLDKSLEDRMESFFLSETLKYLYLLFDEDNRVNKHEERLLFTTEGHILPLSSQYQTPLWDPIATDRTDKPSYFCAAHNPLLRYALPVEVISWKSNNPDHQEPRCSQ
ncbi:ER degradation-enhancing alpha-mannosidase-like protein 1 [Hypsibius exemplaris]|uniref:alpha-1,2-Mannosidase n=1 Tax=Hypsibius exemplaris TaxID=2072580 RepID=A0A1W0WXF9_HYPEX|nr:ER degradation-enhancing alpha-mannosidase-like protein 1 [Hypsibius exemplaris]